MYRECETGGVWTRFFTFSECFVVVRVRNLTRNGAGFRVRGGGVEGYLFNPLMYQAPSQVDGRPPSGVVGSHWIQLTYPSGWRSSRWVNDILSQGKFYFMREESVVGMCAKVGHMYGFVREG